MELSENARRVMSKRLLKRNRDGEIIERSEDMFRRVAENIARADERYADDATAARTAEEFYETMVNLEFLPNSPALMNAGRRLQQLAACFVLEVNDSIEEIFDTLKQASLIHQSGGGTGFSFSKLRPTGDYVSSSGGHSSGPISFMRVFDEATEAMNQGGFRRGANMGILRVDHPDIMDFIRAKNREGELRNFNISVGVTDAFMAAVRADGSFDLVNPRTGQVHGCLRAREVFDTIVESAWQNGEPGIIFIDRINADNPTPALGPIEATNPCGEAPLLPYESCVLGSINLTKIARDGEIDWDRLARLVGVGVHLLDNIIDVSRYPLPQITERTMGNRKIGLGVMGFADLLFMLGVPYDSDEGVTLGGRIMQFVQREANAASERLAETRGVFPNWHLSRYEAEGRRLRNAIRTTIAPTGTLSILADCSSGIEPVFALAFYRFVMDERLREVNPVFVHVARERGFYSETLMDALLRGGSAAGMADVPADAQRVFVTARDIAPAWHLRMQAAFQQFTDNAVSKTLNLPPESTREDVREIIMMACESGCKGLTVYRSTSRISQVLATECDCFSCAAKSERNGAQ